MITHLWDRYVVPLRPPLFIPLVFWIETKGLTALIGFFSWYNTEHLRSGIDHVTPEHCHRGLREDIISARKANLNKQRLLRKEVKG